MVFDAFTALSFLGTGIGAIATGFVVTFH